MVLEEPRLLLPEKLIAELLQYHCWGFQQGGGLFHHEYRQNYFLDLLLVLAKACGVS